MRQAGVDDYETFVKRDPRRRSPTAPSRSRWSRTTSARWSARHSVSRVGRATSTSRSRSPTRRASAATPLMRRLAARRRLGQCHGVVHRRRRSHGRRRRSPTGPKRSSRCSPAASPTPASTRCRSCSRALEVAQRPRATSNCMWASPREVLNIVQADEIGCDIITVTRTSSRRSRRSEGPRRVLARRPSRCSATTPSAPNTSSSRAQTRHTANVEHPNW